MASYQGHRTTHRYAHEHTCTLRIENDFWDKQAHAFRIGELESLLDELRIDACQEIYSALQKEYEYLTGDEAIIETIEANEYDFTADGKLA